MIKSLAILVHAVFKYITEELSFQRLADYMACHYKVVMSDTAWKKQFLKIAPIFLSVAMMYLGKNKPSLPPETKVVYALDATDFSAQGALGTVTRVHTMLSLTDCLHTFTHITDRHIPESAAHFPLERGTLYIADRAYGKARQIDHIRQNHADFIFRVSPNLIQLYRDEACTERLDVKSMLDGEGFSRQCYIKFKKNTYSLRLIAAPIPPEKQDTAQKRVRRKASKKQNQIKPSTLLYANWMFLLTSLPDSVVSDDIIALYKQRWQIELFFKRAKSLLRFHKIRRSSELHAKTVTMLWLFVVYVLVACQLAWNKDISLFNSFSLAMLVFS